MAMSNRKTEDLELVVTVRGTNLDSLLRDTKHSLRYAGASKLGFVRASEVPAIQIVDFKRMDGQEIGLTAEFEEYWRNVRCEGDADEWNNEKTAAWGAFQAAADIYGGEAQ